MKDELQQLDESIKGLTNLRDKNLEDEQYRNYLSDAIDALCRRQEDLILQYEEIRKNMDNIPIPKMVNGYDENDGWYDDEF